MATHRKLSSRSGDSSTDLVMISWLCGRGLSKQSAHVLVEQNFKDQHDLLVILPRDISRLLPAATPQDKLQLKRVIEELMQDKQEEFDNSLDDLIKRSKKLHITTDGPDEYQLPLTPGESSDLLKKYQLGTQPDVEVELPRTLLFVGQTGSGKSTLVDTITNYIYQINFDGSTRLRLIDKELDCGEHKQSIAHSQTHVITQYTLYPGNGSILPYTLNIIDTPGFADTKGIKHDRKLVDNLKKLFGHEQMYELQGVDAVCFVVKHSDYKLTDGQKYIYEQVLGLFGENIKDNIIMFVTFCDSDKPKVIEGLKAASVEYSDFICLNNSSVFGKGSGLMKTINVCLWRMTMDNLEKFFKTLKSLELKSLALSAKVLRERRKLLRVVKGMLKLVQNTLDKMDNLDATKRELQQLITQKGKDSSVSVAVARTVKRKCDEMNVNCEQCLCTCEESCEKYSYVFDHWWSTGQNRDLARKRCAVCKCEFKTHIKELYRYTSKQEVKSCKPKELAEKYKKQYKDTAALMEDIHQDIINAKAEVSNKMRMMHEHMNKLNSIALRPQISSMADYVGFLLTTESTEKGGNYKNRTRWLKRLKEAYSLLGALHDNPKLDIWSYMIK